MKWYKGTDRVNSTGTDKFYSASKDIAGDYGKATQIDSRELPKNPLEMDSKEELAPLIGYKGDPLAEPKLPLKQRFDTLAKKYAQSKGFDGIIYFNGTFDQPELHTFPKDTRQEATL